jgi:HSP20 family protein
MYSSLFPGDLFAEMDRLQRQLQSTFDTFSPSIRGSAGAFPALNVGGTPDSVEIYAFAPGLDPKAVEVHLERGVLTIEGERQPELPAEDRKATVHSHERFAGRFRRVISLPDDVDPQAVDARYVDGVLHIHVRRQAAAQPRRIEVS